MSKRTYFFAALAFFLPLGLYVKTLSPTYIPIDSAEFALCIKYWGVCHPPGFPLYVAIGHFFVELFPIGTLIYKANLLSSIYGAGTIFFVYLVQLRLGVRVYTAFLVSLFLAAVQVFWEFSVAADVFTFSTFLIAISLYLLLSKRWLFAFFVLGLTASHFYITAILFPLYYWYLYGFKIRIRDGIGAGLMFTLAFFPQVIMYFRMQADPAVNWGHAQGLLGFWKFIRREEFGNIFLISNPVLTFSLFKTFGHIIDYIKSLFINFGFVLAVVGFAGVVFVRGKAVIFLIAAFSILVIVQLFLLSTIESGPESVFQLNKFYLPSFMIMAILAGIGIDYLNNRFLAKDSTYSTILLVFMIGIFLLANFKINNYSQNYFSENLVLDAMEQLPDDAVAITVSHIVYFGGRYEQEENGKFGGVKLLYFPNEKNRDGEFYQPQLFEGNADEKFKEKIKKDKNIEGIAENYVLEVIAKNLDHEIYILQGTFEENFFGFLRPYLEPHGLWWKIRTGSQLQASEAAVKASFDNLRNKGVGVEDLELKQQRNDLLAYAVAYHSAAVALGAQGDWDGAIEYFKKAIGVNPDAPTTVKINDEILLIEETKRLEEAYKLGNLDTIGLEKIGENLIILGNFERCVELYSEFKSDSGSAESYSHLGTCLSELGKIEESKLAFSEALSIEPNFEAAKRGLEGIEK